MEKQAYTVKEFCAAFGIGKTVLYELWQEGNGPKKFKVKKRILISRSAAKQWLLKQEGKLPANAKTYTEGFNSCINSI